VYKLSGVSLTHPNRVRSFCRKESYHICVCSDSRWVMFYCCYCRNKSCLSLHRFYFKNSSQHDISENSGKQIKVEKERILYDWESDLDLCIRDYLVQNLRVKFGVCRLFFEHIRKQPGCNPIKKYFTSDMFHKIITYSSVHKIPSLKRTEMLPWTSVSKTCECRRSRSLDKPLGLSYPSCSRRRSVAYRNHMLCQTQTQFHFL
jgi:hypothetical protein